MSTELNNDGVLLERLANNEHGALELLFKQYYKPLVRFANEIVKSKDQAEDMVQEVFVKIWEKRNQMTPQMQLKSYLYVAVKNHCLNQLKLNDRKYWMEDDMEDDIRLSIPDASEQVDAKQLQSKIEDAINALPPKCSLIFKMSRFEEKSYKEIAEALELSIKTVENQMGKALALLRQSVGSYIGKTITMIATVVWNYLN
ncbi:MAG: RNA polymerase sigma-70 factor [Bacteroidia bacterium]|jgi:RNA polymerase sigma-70 factor (ECF subfamily)|nr:RNA polymerase sigma-70 factor [Bacteroidia bacterium]